VLLGAKTCGGEGLSKRLGIMKCLLEGGQDKIFPGEGPALVKTLTLEGWKRRGKNAHICPHISHGPKKLLTSPEGGGVLPFHEPGG